jgi:hypothetical protein
MAIIPKIPLVRQLILSQSKYFEVLHQPLQKMQSVVQPNLIQNHHPEQKQQKELLLF